MRPADLAPDTLRRCLQEYARVIFYFSHFLSQVGYRAHQSDDGAGDTHQNSPKQSAMKADRSGESGKDSVSAAGFFPACACTRVNSYTRGDVTSLTTEISLVCFFCSLPTQGIGGDDDALWCGHDAPSFDKSFWDTCAGTRSKRFFIPLLLAGE